MGSAEWPTSRSRDGREMAHEFGRKRKRAPHGCRAVNMQLPSAAMQAILRHFAPLSAALWALALAGCADNPGVDPPLGELNFPIAIQTITPDGADRPRYALIANSNFDLRYNGGSLQLYNLDALAGCVRDLECESLLDDCGDVVDQNLPGVEGTIECPGLFVDEVVIGSFADSIALSPDQSRVYLPVRSDANLSFVNLDMSAPVGADGRAAMLDCGQGADRRCTRDFNRGDEAEANRRGIELPADPVDIYVGSLETDFLRSAGSGNYAVVAHRGGSVSLFLDEVVAGATAPRLVHTLVGLPEELVTLTRDPRTGLFWAPSAFRPNVARVGIALDAEFERLDDSFVFNSGTLSVSGVSSVSATRGDTREVVFDPRGPEFGAYILSRRPSALFFVDSVESRSTLEIEDLVDLGVGPSRVAITTFEGYEETEGDPSTFVALPRPVTLAFVSCFDSRDVYVVDVDLRSVVAVVPSAAGPFELEVDEARGYVYLVDFRSSVIRVIDLRPSFECYLGGVEDPGARECTPLQRGRIGTPRPVQELR